MWYCGEVPLGVHTKVISMKEEVDDSFHHFILWGRTIRKIANFR
jgi:hypothetical protein